MPYTMSTRKTWQQTYQSLADTFQRWGVTQWAVEANVQSRQFNAHNLPRSEAAVTIRYTKRTPHGDRDVMISLATQDSPRENLRALYLCLEDMRMLEVRGVSDVAASAYMQLEAPRAKDAWAVLGLRDGATKDEIEAMFRAKAKTAHPDAGGSNEAMAALNAARDAALAASE